MALYSRDELIPGKLPEENITSYEVKWTPNGVDPPNSEGGQNIAENSCYYDTVWIKGIYQYDQMIDRFGIYLYCLVMAKYPNKHYMTVSESVILKKDCTS